MSTEGEDWPDVEGAMRTYLRNDAGLVPLINGRVFFSVPKNSSGKGVAEGSFPLILVTRIGGGESRGEAPLDMALLQFDVMGKKSEQAGGGKGPTTIVALALQKAISKIRGRTELTPGVTAFNARIASSFYSPFPGDDRPRQIITAVIPSIVTTV